MKQTLLGNAELPERREKYAMVYSEKVLMSQGVFSTGGSLLTSQKK
jgi:hypothetical protein